MRLRLEREQPLSFLEFNYMVLQAYDFLELARRHDCARADGRLGPVGQHRHAASSSAGASTSRTLFGLTSPLITTASGAKMGKTAQGAVWLNADRLSPYDYWQFWRNTEDADVGRFLRLFTDLPLDEIARLEALAGQRDQSPPRKCSPTEATALCHGREAAEAAAETGARVFAEGGIGDDLPVIEMRARRTRGAASP